MAQRTVFYLSDHTAITAEKLARSLLAQFAGLRWSAQRLAFVDSAERAADAVERIHAAFLADGLRPLVFGTLADEALRERIEAAPCIYLDPFETWLPLLQQELGPAAIAVGHTHGSGRRTTQGNRIAAMHYALANDDGACLSHYAEADLILVGVSRSGKTPVSLYLALEYGLRCANYPLTEEDLAHDRLPAALVPYRDRLVGLTVDPLHLSRMRQERRPGTRYAAPDRCRREVRAAARIFQGAGLPVLDTTDVSIEEIATRILHLRGESAALEKPG